MSVDVLVFGPHPDDLEIGLGGTIARHTAQGLTVGLCDLTAGELGSNGTVDERLAEAEAARAVLGPPGGRTCAGPIVASVPIRRMSSRRWN
jgi:LmbE family N-acetylglucosaminyl deacetylase